MAEEAQTSPNMVARFLGVSIPAILALVIVLAGAGVTAFTVKKYPQVLGLSKGPADIQRETDRLVVQVGKLIALPSDEKPTVATITDLDKLKDQPFFKNAKNGDKVLIYTNAKKAILYRESENRIVEVGAVNINQQATLQNAKFVINNGTSVSGLTKVMEDLLKKVVPSAVVDKRGNATKRDYLDTILVDLSGTKGDLTNQLAQTLGAKVASLPQGEAKPEGEDFLIIIGSDKVQHASPSPSASPTSGESPSPAPTQ